MDKSKLSIAGVGAAVITAMAILLGQKFINSAEDTISQGQNAALIAQIEEVLVTRDKVIVNGDTMTTAEALSKIATNQAIMQQQIQALVD